MSKHGSKALERRVEDLHVRATWTHKIHEKQADIYESYARVLTMASLLFTAATASGVLGILLAGSFAWKVASATLSFLSIFVSLLAKTADYPARAQVQRHTAKTFLGLREDAETLIADIRAKAISPEELSRSVDDLTTRYKDACMAAPSTSDRAVKRASASLKAGESTVTEAEKARIVPGYKRSL